MYVEIMINFVCSLNYTLHNCCRFSLHILHFATVLSDIILHGCHSADRYVTLVDRTNCHKHF